MDRENLSWTNGNGTIPRWRAPTADEALQYSPLSSIIPFSSGMLPITLYYIHWHRTAGEPLTSAWSLSLAFTYARVISQHLDILKCSTSIFPNRCLLLIDIVPYPSALPASTSSVFVNEDDRNASRSILNSLNQEVALNSQSTSDHLERTLHDLQQLLNAEDLTHL